MSETTTKPAKSATDPAPAGTGVWRAITLLTVNGVPAIGPGATVDTSHPLFEQWKADNAVAEDTAPAAE